MKYEAFKGYIPQGFSDSKYRAWRLSVLGRDGRSKVVLVNPLGYESVLKNGSTKFVRIKSFGLFDKEFRGREGRLMPYVETVK